MMSFLQNILVDSDHHKFVMTPGTAEVDVVGIVLIGLLPTNHIIILQ